MTAEWAISRKVRLSKRVSVEITGGPAGTVCEWDPLPSDLPGQTLTKAEFRKYRAARDELLAEVGRRLGGSVLVVET